MLSTEIVMRKNNVIVIGALHHNTLGVIRSLGEAGVDKENIFVLLVVKNLSSKNLISSSKYVDLKHIYLVEDYKNIVPWLKNHASCNEKSVIICCSDGSAGAVMESQEELKDSYITPSTLLPISNLMVKSNQDKYAQECGLSVPISADFDTGEQICWDDFPCIVKPYKSAMLAGKSDIHILRSKEELEKVLKTIQSDRIQIQKYIEKRMEFQLIGCSLDAGKTIIIPGFTSIIRQPKTTNTGYLLYSPIEQLNYDREAVERFIKTIGYSGLFSVEFIRGKDGKDYFLEINMRNDGNAYCVESAGINLPYIWVYYQTYGELPDVPTTFEEPVYFIPDLNDLKLAFRKIGIFKWLKQFRQAKSHSIYNKEDMAPFRFELKRQVKKIFKP